jgi:two-component system phosphate regulon sensor histidine kinase PhoR
VLRAPEVGDNLREFLPTLPEQWLIPGQDTQREITFGREGRSERFLLIKTTPVAGLGKADDGDRGFVVVVRDVTQSKEVDMLKRDFLSVVTHELKTPLTAIEGYTKLLLMGKGGELNEKQIRFLGTIKEQTTTLNTMIQDLLDITRLEAGRLPLSMADLGAKEVIEEAFEAHAGGAQTRGLSMRLDVSKVEGVKFRADPFRLQQVLGNLIGNAFKFTPKGGEVALIGGSDDKSVWFSVSDTGRGIPAEAIPQLFGKFYQVQRGDTRVAGGAGLGLYISKQLTEAQGGEIDVTSTEGVGSIFTVRFSNGDVPAAVERDTLE